MFVSGAYVDRIAVGLTEAAVLQVSTGVSELLRKVGITLSEAQNASTLDWKGKGLGPTDCKAMAELLPGCARLKELKCASNPNMAVVR